MDVTTRGNDSRLLSISRAAQTDHTRVVRPTKSTGCVSFTLSSKGRACVPPMQCPGLSFSRMKHTMTFKHKYTLIGFVNEFCGNRTEKGCTGVTNKHQLFHEGSCLIAQGKPCKFFETTVLPICDPAYKYATEPGSYQVILAAYLKINPNLRQNDEQNVRLCKCGKALLPRKRLCPKCQKDQRQKAYRQYKDKTRKGVGSCATVN